MVEKTELEIEDGVRWFELTGEDYGTGVVFEKNVYGLTDDNTIVDSENCPIECESDYEAIAVRNNIN